METILPSLLKKNHKNLPYSKQILKLSDGDFIEYDFYSIIPDAKTLVICSHGLEGNSQRPYLSGFVAKFLENNSDVIAWNFRGCGMYLNDKPHYYHSGFTSDLKELIQNELNKNIYDSIVLIGVSVGGNITLKYLGEQGGNVSTIIKAAFALSVPCDLEQSSNKLSKGFNTIYLNRFLKSLKSKIDSKSTRFKEVLPTHTYSIKTFEDFDNYYTAKFHNYKDAIEYYNKNSSKHFIPSITIPTLLLTALNDPFLTPECIPYQQAEQNPNFYLEVSKTGGHVGFNSSFNFQEAYYEKRAFEFIKQYI